MKEIEKRAQQYLVSRPGYDEFYENDYCQNNYSDVRAAFIAGFKAAREMAAHIVKVWDTSWYEDDTRLEAQRHDRETRIRNLGEREET